MGTMFALILKETTLNLIKCNHNIFYEYVVFYNLRSEPGSILRISHESKSSKARQDTRVGLANPSYRPCTRRFLPIHAFHPSEGWCHCVRPVSTCIK